MEDKKIGEDALDKLLLAVQLRDTVMLKKIIAGKHVLIISDEETPRLCELLTGAASMTVTFYASEIPKGNYKSIRWDWANPWPCPGDRVEFDIIIARSMVCPCYPEEGHIHSETQEMISSCGSTTPMNADDIIMRVAKLLAPGGIAYFTNSGSDISAYYRKAAYNFWWPIIRAINSVQGLAARIVETDTHIMKRFYIGFWIARRNILVQKQYAPTMMVRRLRGG